MKKYLMIGAAALMMGASFTSCSKDKDLFDPQANALKFLQEYQAAFYSVFGEISPNQTWGFGSVSESRMTRTENANANEWADPNKEYGGLLVPPALTDEQIAVVKKYFQTHPNLGYQDPGWSNYFIQQVYKGHTDVPQGCATPEAYLAANGSTYIIASDHMDHLIAVDDENEIYDHINNFNHGDCSVNSTVLDNGGNANDGPFHTDKIMYMRNSTTKSFGYHNSDGSLYHTEYTGLVSYKTIMAAMGAEANCLDDGWNRSFMGFDFEQMVGNDVYSVNKIVDYQAGWKSPEQYEEGVEYVDGFPVISVTYNTFEFEGNTYNFLTAETNMYAADLKEESYKEKNGSTSTTGGKANFNDRPSDDIIRDLLSKGYLPYSDTLKDWVKVGGTADGYFSDWIVTLTEAKTRNSSKPALRVIAEDLTKGEKGDFDFNDVVFDAEYIDANKVKVTIQAAGGTLPLTVYGMEVHELFKNANPDAKTDQGGEINTMTMINTEARFVNLKEGSSSAELPNKPEFFITDKTWSDNADRFAEEVRDNIKVYVTKYDDEGRALNPLELTAERGETPGKVAVGTSYNWKKEREYIGENFKKFVSDPTYAMWWRE